MVSYLNPDTQLSQFERSRSFANGLAQVLKAFGEKFKITLRGMRRSYWAIGPEDPANVWSGTFSSTSSCKSFSLLIRLLGQS